MRIEQQPGFNPIAVILETKDEAEIFWDVVEAAVLRYAQGSEKRELLVKISNLFTTQVRL